MFDVSVGGEGGRPAFGVFQDLTQYASNASREPASQLGGERVSTWHLTRPGNDARPRGGEIKKAISWLTLPISGVLVSFFLLPCLFSFSGEL